MSTARAEGRDPSPTTSPYAQRASSIDEEEPWDEAVPSAPPEQDVEPARPSLMSSMMCSEFFDPTEELEDGDLPTLSRKNTPKSAPEPKLLVSSQKSTRPLNPPSMAGLQVDESPIARQKRRAFWSQLDIDPPSPSTRDEEDGPDDEVAARQASNTREISGVPQQPDEVITGEQDIQPTVSELSTEMNCFDEALTSLGNICGTGEAQVDSPPRQQRAIPQNASEAEEQTAIEVEYVGKDDAGATGNGENEKGENQSKSPASAWSPSKKNAFLASMARKAKEDFESKESKQSKRGLQPPKPEDERAPNMGNEEDSSDLYSSFSASEKRKFVKLINSGMAPSEAARKITEDRENANKKTPEGGKSRFGFFKKKSAKKNRSQDDSAIESPNKAQSSSPLRRGRRSRSVETPSSSKRNDNNTAAVATAAAVGAVAVGGATAVAVTKDSSSTPALVVSPPAGESRSTTPAGAPVPTSRTPVEPEMDSTTPQKSMEASAPSRPSKAKTSRSDIDAELPDSLAAATPAASAVAPQDEPKVADDTESPPSASTNQGTKIGAAAVAVTGTAAAVSAAVVANSSSEDEIDSFLGQFEKSGSNYYDAVRKDIPEEDEGEEEEQSAATLPVPASPRSARLSSKRVAPRKSFVPLGEKESPTKPSAPVEPLPKRQMEADVDERSAALSPKSPRSSRSILGIRVPGGKKAGFTPLEDDEEDGQDDSHPAAVAATAAAVAAATSAGVAAAHRDNEDRPHRLVQSTPGEEPSPSLTLPDMNPVVAPRSQEPVDLDSVDSHSMESPARESVKPKESAAPAEEQYDIDAQAAVMMERELLRPTAGLTETEEEAMAAEERDTVFDLDESKDNDEDPLDVSLDVYLESATVASYSSNQHQDHASVVSGKSAWTNATGASSVYTQSSRKRHHGAAKKRLAKAKEVENLAVSKAGWHESIREVASKNKKVWDPEKGWVDYVDPDALEVPTVSTERLNVSLEHISLKPVKETEDDSGSVGKARSEPGAPKVVVPFPKDWEAERNAMLTGEEQGGVGLAAQLPRAPSPLPVQDYTREAKDSVSLSAVAKENSDKRWDPERGWIGKDEELAPPAYEGATLESQALGNSKETPEANYAALAATTAAVGATAGVATVVASGDSGEDSQSGAMPRSAPAKTVDDSSPLNSWINKSAQPPKNRTEQSTEASDVAVASGGPVTAEKYMQLGDNGSVRSVHQDAPLPTAKKSKGATAATAAPAAATSGLVNAASFVDDDDEAPLLKSTGYYSDQERGPDVKVVKEKVGEDDFSLFTQDESTKDDGPKLPKSPSVRRGKGPVDLDEIDSIDSEEDESEDDDSTWEADSYMTGSISKTLFDKPAGKSKSVDTSDSTALAAKSDSLPSKTPPRLQKNRRDTSPIRGRGEPKKSADGVAVVAPVAAAAAVASATRDKPRSSYSRQPQEEDTRTVRTDLSELSTGSSVRQRAQQWESMSGRSPKTSTTAQTESLLGVHYAADDSTNKEAHDESQNVPWPTSGDERRPRKENSAGTAEWKSFLGKKVQAESAAAVKQERGSTKKEPEGDVAIADYSKGVKSTSGNKLVAPQPRNTEDDDSLFEFAASEIERQRDAKSSENAPSKSRDLHTVDDDFSDISPIHKNDEDEMEKVSDTGTAVEQGSFMKRLQACAAPMMPRQFTQSGNGGAEGGGEGNAVPMAHLAFLRTNPPVSSGSGGGGSSRFVPPALCGRPDTIVEDDSIQGSPPRKQSSSRTDASRRSKSNPRSSSRRGDLKDTSSVTSEDFEPKKSYLESIAMKTAVSKPRRSDSRRKSSSSDVSTGSRPRSERFQALLEKRASQSSHSSGSKARSSTEVSKAAEKYAAEKVEEMLEVMASRSKSAPASRKTVDDMIDSMSSGSTSPPPSEAKSTRSQGSRTKAKKKSESAVAAEDLAAARVEAMMASMTSSNLDQGEI